MPIQSFRPARSLFSLSLGLLIVIASPSAEVGKGDDFPVVINSQKPGEEPPSPQEAVAAMTFPDGDPNWRVTVFAAEPNVQQPIAFDFDDRGRLWVAENYSYAGGPYDAKHRDRVIILEDADGDGRHDRRTVFWDDGWMLTGVTWGFGGLWVLNHGTLCFIPDRDGDDIPDSEPVVLLDGWTFDARHNFVNGLLWGPDGWLYGRHGITDTSYPGIPGTPRERRTPMNCGIWRFHPTRKVFEVVCRGTTNPWGLDYDEHGQMFFTNNVIGHLWHVIPGAHYRRMFGVDFNPHLYDLIDQHADHYHWDTTGNWTDSRDGGAHAAGGGHSHCGGMIYLGDNWPQKYRGSMLMCNIHGRRVNRDVLVRHGSGYRARHADDLLLANQPWFRGVELKYGPDGGVFLADWVDHGECHDHDGVHRTSGRIYKITYGDVPRGATRYDTGTQEIDLAALTNRELLELQFHENEWFVRRSRRLLQERAARGGDVSSAIREALKPPAGATRTLRMLWLAHVTGIGRDDSITELLSSWHMMNEPIRIWLVRLAVNEGEPEAAVIDRFTEMAKEDPAPSVRLALASALQRISLEDRWRIAANLAAHAEDADDHNLPLMIWYGIEPAVPSNPGRAVALAAEAKIPLVRRFITRRLSADLETHHDAVDSLLAGALERDDAYALDVLGGLSEALRGVRRADPTPRWDRVSQRLAKRDNTDVRRLTQELSLIFGDGRAADALIEIARDETADRQARRTAIASLVEARAEGFDDTLLAMITDRIVQEEALAGLASYDHPKTAGTIIRLFPKIRAECREQAVATLASRPQWAVMLLRAIEGGKIPTSVISAVAARQMLSLDSPEVTRLLEQVWGVIDRTDADKQQLIAEWRQKLTPASLAGADLSHGRALFNKTCASCHKLYGDGGAIGPDITGSNRHNLSYLLENILDPNRTVPQQWTTSIVVLTSGRVITGVVMRQSEQTWTVQTAKEQITIPTAEIDESKLTNLSLMPDGQFNALTDHDVRDLMAYLQSSQQVPLPE